MWVRVVVILVFLSMLPFGGYAVNPTDDDAGSGGDAGDTLSTATPIGFDRLYQGRIVPPADMRDVFVLSADRGDLLVVDCRSDSGVFIMMWQDLGDGLRETSLAVCWFAEASVIGAVNESGRVFLSFEASSTASSPASYSFTVEREPGRTVAILASDNPAVVEVAMPYKTAAALGIYIHVPEMGNEPAATKIGVDHRRDEQGNFTYGTSYAAFVQEGALAAFPKGPADQAYDLVQDGTLRGQVWAGGWNTRGDMTGYAFGKNIAADYVVTVWAASDVPVAHGTGGSILSWGPNPGDSPFDTFVAGIHGARRADVALTNRTVGTLWADTADAYMRDPAGRHFPAAPHPRGGGWIPVSNPAAGEWQLGVNATVHAGEGHRIQFLAMDRPSLGLAAERELSCPSERCLYG